LEIYLLILFVEQKVKLFFFTIWLFHSRQLDLSQKGSYDDDDDENEKKSI
jgi:hypothetical protein